MGRPEFNNNGLRIAGGLGCNGCHRAPEFDIDPDSRNNGVTLSLDGTGSDTEVTRSPSLRDLFDREGEENGLLMHTGDMTISQVLDHYNQIQNDENTDRRLVPRGTDGQNLAMTEAEKNAVIAFLKTLTGNDVYENDKWSDPFSN